MKKTNSAIVLLRDIKTAAIEISRDYDDRHFIKEMCIIWGGAYVLFKYLGSRGASLCLGIGALACLSLLAARVMKIRQERGDLRRPNGFWHQALLRFTKG
jgi:hypothetical protein